MPSHELRSFLIRQKFKCAGCGAHGFEMANTEMSRAGVLRIYVTCKECRKVHLIQLSPIYKPRKEAGQKEARR